VLTRELPPLTTSSLPVHPTALYELLGGGALIGLALLLSRRNLRPGLVFGGVALAYLLLRVSLDSLRDDPVEMWVSRALFFVIIVIAAFLAAFRLSRK
jgi:prolipoprotein diacylglyceryltransferase